MIRELKELDNNIPDDIISILNKVDYCHMKSFDVTYFLLLLSDVLPQHLELLPENVNKLYKRVANVAIPDEIIELLHYFNWEIDAQVLLKLKIILVKLINTGLE